MAGLLDEVMDGIAAKEKPGEQKPAAPTTPQAGEKPPADGTDKPLHTYSDDFKKQYGDRNGEKKTA